MRCVVFQCVCAYCVCLCVCERIRFGYIHDIDKSKSWDYANWNKPCTLRTWICSPAYSNNSAYSSWIYFVQPNNQPTNSCCYSVFSVHNIYSLYGNVLLREKKNTHTRKIEKRIVELLSLPIFFDVFIYLFHLNTNKTQRNSKKKNTTMNTND